MSLRTALVVTGQQAAAADILRMWHQLVGEFQVYVTRQVPYWDTLIKQTVRHVVYVGSPKEYSRNENLIAAATAKETSTVVVASAEIFNDDSKVTLRGGGVSAGGSRKEDVPGEIEFGDYPTPWFGDTGPRPAYLIFADTIRPQVYADADAIIARVVK